MYGRSGPSTFAALALASAAAAVSMAAVAGGPPGTVPDVTRPQIMLYVSHPIGWRGPSYNTYGLRYERISPSSSDPGARLYIPLRHRSLIDLQLTHGLSPRVLFGPRVTWDLGRSQLGPTSMLSAYPWPMSKQLPGTTPLAYWAP